MFQAAERGCHECNDWIEEPLRAALDAIAPMVGDLTSKVFVAGYMAALDRARQNANPDQLLRDWGFKG